MKQDRKTEIVTECVSDALKELRNDFRQEIEVSFNADYLKGKIVIRVNV
jgi:hypothetical protein